MDSVNLTGEKCTAGGDPYARVVERLPVYADAAFNHCFTVYSTVAERDLAK